METLTPNYGLRKQDEDEFYSETINSDNMDIIDAELKKSADHIADTGAHVTAEKQAAWDNLKTFQTAGGTGTAITLTGVEMVDGFQTTFVILASNSGAGTTINAKPLYKPGSTTAPKLVAGKAVTVWYNLAGDCFFIKASAEGTATAGDVLAGVTFSNDDDIGISGTLSLTGDALITDVKAGKIFYNTDAKTKLTGTNTDKKFTTGSLTGYVFGQGQTTSLRINGLTFAPKKISVGVYDQYNASNIVVYDVAYVYNPGNSAYMWNATTDIGETPRVGITIPPGSDYFDIVAINQQAGVTRNGAWWAAYE